jgi:hypothetical protein
VSFDIAYGWDIGDGWYFGNDWHSFVKVEKIGVDGVGTELFLLPFGNQI